MEAERTPRRWRGGGVRFVFAAGYVAAVTLAVAAEADPKSAPCVSVRAVVRVKYPGYDHVVELSNSCDEDHACEVTTDVSPEIIRVFVRGHGTQSVLTRRGSSAREFTPKAVCTPRASP